MLKYAMALSLAAATAITAPAQAATFLVDVGPDVSSAFFGNSSKASGAFSDTFKFTVPDGSVSAFVGSIALLSKLDVALKHVDRDGLTLFHQDLSGYEEKWSLSDTLIGAGNHTINVSGTWGTKGGSYSGTLNFAPVPEPATWAMMIGGFGLVGAAMRRRRSTMSVAVA